MQPDPTALPPMTRNAYRALLDAYIVAAQRRERAYRGYADYMETDRLLTTATYEMRLGFACPTITQIAARKVLEQNVVSEIRDATAAMDAAEDELNRAALRPWADE